MPSGLKTHELCSHIAKGQIDIAPPPLSTMLDPPVEYDAMSLTNEHVDRIVGYEDVGDCRRTTKVANQGLVAVIRDIFGSWKLPIGYYLIRDN